MRPAGWILLGTLVFVAFAVWSESVAANTLKPAAAPVIAIVSGTWGANCGAPHGNATRDLARRCDGLRTCGYVLDARAMSSPPSRANQALPSPRIATSSGACRVDYRARWRCGSHEVHDAALGATASPGDTLVLSCVHENGPGH
ncbi:hypothetical protein LMG28688_05607 [Paraburkholderia caffeinitolerans]|uniref:Uncharacterized protein n=1 Tax=Paraburkholderia caffeinitolerans TaxID=1723730 RepID=A0A6J5GKU4_9BURK|nr:hypothetical protein [Paraburkholderia caffeinitolerans]CAB3802650.1 hypothetical protein LMG28688_05607 [Paraburkholderia caffeinitolerans]